MGIVGLIAPPKRRPWPRWVGYLALWLSLLAVPASLIAFFQTGPFAWDGLFGFWVPLTAFVGFFAAMTPLVLEAIRSMPPDGTEVA